MKGIIRNVLAAVAAGTTAGAFAGALEVNVASGTQENFTPEQAAAIASPDCDEIVKTGDGTLKITDATAVKDFAGKITIAAGIYEVAISSAGALGVTGANAKTATYVQSGGALVFSHADKTTGSYAWEWLFIEGDGPAGAAYPGAVVRLGKVVYLGRIILTGNASFGGNDILHINDNQSLDLAGYTLTVRKGLSFGMTTILNPGRIDFAGGDVYMPALTKYFPDGAGHEMHFGAGTTVKFIGPQTEPNGWTWVLDGNVTFDIPKDKGCTALALYNDIVLNNGATLTVNEQNLRRMDLYGNITGEGSLVKAANASFPSALWLHGTNTYTGTTTIPGGGNRDVIVAMDAQSLPGWEDGRADGAFTAERTGLGFGIKSEGNPEGWDGEDVTNVLARAAGKNSQFFLAVEAGDSGTFTNDLALSGVPYFGTIGGGEVKYTGRFATGASPHFYPFTSTNELIVTREEGDARQQDLAVLRAYDGVLRFKDAGKIRHTGSSGNDLQLIIGLIGGAVPRVRFEGETDYYNSYRLTIPEGLTCKGVAEVCDGASVTAVCLFGNHSPSMGCLYQSGGTFTAAGGSVFGNDIKSEGYLEVSGGTAIFPGNAYFAQMGSAKAGTANLPIGMLYQTGGQVKQTDGNDKVLGIGVGGHGVYYMKGGKYLGKNAIYIPRARTETDYTAGSGNLTVSGANTEMEISLSGVYLCDRDSSVGFFNVMDGATVALRAIAKASKTSVGSVALGSDRKAYVGFSGGIVKALRTGTLITAAGPDYITAYAGGAIIDTAGFDVEIQKAIQAPNGAGVVAITVPNAPLAGYIAPPRVEITGDGEGASAVAEFDSASGTVTGVTVTSPGWGYAQGTTTVKLIGTETTVTCEAMVANDAGTGGLTKRGEGTLVLPVDNSYVGPTVIEAGYLQTKSARGIPEGSEVVVKGGTLQVAAGGAMPANWRIDMDFDNLDKSVKYTLVEVTAKGVVPTLPSGGVPDDWSVRIVGNKVKAGYRHGMAIIVR